MLNSISRACIQQAVHAGPLYVTTTISVGLANYFRLALVVRVPVCQFLAELRPNLDTSRPLDYLR